MGSAAAVATVFDERGQLLLDAGQEVLAEDVGPSGGVLARERLELLKVELLCVLRVGLGKLLGEELEVGVRLRELRYEVGGVGRQDGGWAGAAGAAGACGACGACGAGRLLTANLDQSVQRLEILVLVFFVLIHADDVAAVDAHADAFGLAGLGFHGPPEHLEKTLEYLNPGVPHKIVAAVLHDDLAEGARVSLNRSDDMRHRVVQIQRQGADLQPQHVGVARADHVEQLDELVSYGLGRVAHQRDHAVHQVVHAFQVDDSGNHRLVVDQRFLPGDVAVVSQ